MRRSSLTATNTGLLNGVTISLSTSPVAWNALTTTFANHVGKDVKVVFKGNLVCNATAWYVDIKLTTPFFYDPTKGGLCFDFVRCPTTTARNGYANTAEVTWIPARGLYSSVSADKTSGPGPLTVQFKDTTYTSSAGGVKGWAWDFNGDNKIDSTLQNPKWTFPKTTWDATYDVSLTTTDGVHPTSKMTEKAFITVDPSDAFAVNFGVGSSNKPIQVPLGLPAYSYIYSSTATRGFFFVSPTTFVINGFEAPNDYTTKGIGSVGPASGVMGRIMHVAGNTAVPTMDTIGVPQLGKTAQLDLVGRIPLAQGGVVFMSAGRLPAPVPTMFGKLLINPAIAASFLVPTGTGKLPLPVPNDNALKGVKPDFQALIYNLTSQTYGMSNGVEWFLGK